MSKFVTPWWRRAVPFEILNKIIYIPHIFWQPCFFSFSFCEAENCISERLDVCPLTSLVIKIPMHNTDIWPLLSRNFTHFYFESQRMHAVSIKAPTTIGPGIAPNSLVRFIWCPKAYDCWLTGTHLRKEKIGHFGKYHNTLCLSPQILHKHCFQFLLGLTVVPRENKNNAYAKLGGGDEKRVLWYFPNWPIDAQHYNAGKRWQC